MLTVSKHQKSLTVTMVADTILYDRLNISPTAEQKEIKAAYRIKALQYHPDKYSQGEDEFKKVTEAYSTLTDFNTRARYDRDGFKATLHHEPDEANQDDHAGLGNAIKKYDEFVENECEELREIDTEIAVMLDRWSDPKILDLHPKQVLQLESDNFFDQLVTVFRHYRLTHFATTGDSRSNSVTESKS